mgnify:CR=1 FL=1
MHINPNIEKPIFIQIAEQLEDSIFTGVFPEETKIPSTNEISALLSINPHTVLKGMNMLVDEEIIYKKRGLGMFVKEGAVRKIRLKRQGQFYEQYIASLIEEASKLQMTKEEVISLIERGYEHFLLNLERFMDFWDETGQENPPLSILLQIGFLPMRVPFLLMRFRQKKICRYMKKFSA